MKVLFTVISIYISRTEEVLLKDNRSGYIGLLKNEQIEKLRIELNKNLYAESKQVIHYIKSTFEREYSVYGVVDLLHRIGFSYKQTKQVPCESNPEKQKKFIEKITKIQEVAKEEGSKIYFIDGVHPTHNKRSTYAMDRNGKRTKKCKRAG